MFESPAPDSRLFSSSPSDIQPTNEHANDEKGSLDAYTPSNSESPNDDVAVPAPNNPSSLSEVASQDFCPFDAETLVVHPIMADESSDEKYYKELGGHLIEAMLVFHAWAAARPRHEHHVVCESISSKIAAIEETEKDQELSRKRLADFVKTMTNAVAGLAGI